VAGPVISAALSEAIHANYDGVPEAVMLNFVQPTGSGWGTVDERGFARADETDRRESSPAGRGGAPDVPQGSTAAIASKAAAAMLIMADM
jgi:hypothetical protein